jgi:transglutaminase-like putative cysteine protease
MSWAARSSVTATDVSQRLSIRHSTVYRYRQPVRFDEHRAMFRPRDSHDLRVLDAQLILSPPGEIRWIHDVFSNSIALITFSEPADELRLESRVEIEHYALQDPEWMLREFATSYPFRYDNDQVVDLLSTLQGHYPDPEGAISAWARGFLDPGEATNTMELLARMTRAIKERFRYEERTIIGTQAPIETLRRGGGSCRDFALLMIEAVRSLGLAARFVTGYLYDPARDGAGPGLSGAGSTHAWVQVYLPGAGWIEFDPTNGLVGGPNLIRVGVARDPRQAIPLQGSYRGAAADFIEMEVEVEVTAAG